MRLIKQSFLYFKEGNSDKVYEIDLCDTGNNKFVVNFRYGRRGAQLKEGTKTAVPMAMAEAERIFDEVEKEKLNKGYTTNESGEAPAIAKRTFVLYEEPAHLFSQDWLTTDSKRNKAILKRLHEAVMGEPAHFKTAWKTSRVIWKAGEYKIKEALPYIIRLFNKGNDMQRYSCVWAMIRCGDASVATALKEIFTESKQSGYTAIAGVGVLLLSVDNEKELQLNHYINSLPEDFKHLVQNKNSTELAALTGDRLQQVQTGYKWLEILYILSLELRWLKTIVKPVMEAIPFKPGYFRHIRAVFKIAELTDDFDVLGMLACRIERESEMFTHYLSAADTRDEEVFVPDADDYINLSKEFKKQSSRVAYSNKTKWYIHRRVRRRLKMLGIIDSTDYVKFATGILISYKHASDFRQHYNTTQYLWSNGRYQQTETLYPQNAHAVYLHQILSANHPELVLKSGARWQMKKAPDKKQPKSKSNAKNAGGGIFQKIMSFFSKKEKQVQHLLQDYKQEEAVKTTNENGTPFLHLWNKMPQAYIQLLIDAEMNEIHNFAKENLLVHPDYASLKAKLGKEAIKQLLLSSFAIPAEIGYDIAIEKYSGSIEDYDLILALLNSTHSPAQEKGKEWVEANEALLQSNTDFLQQLLFVEQPFVKEWSKTFLHNITVSNETAQAIAGKVISFMLGLKSYKQLEEAAIKNAGDNAIEFYKSGFDAINIKVIAELIQHPLPTVMLFGLKLLLLNKQHLQMDASSLSFVFSLLTHNYEPVRDAGIACLQELNSMVLLHNTDKLLLIFVSTDKKTRQALVPVIGKLASDSKKFGVEATNTLLSYLLRKESAEGLHEETGLLLRNQLSSFLHDADITKALNLLYSSYPEAQKLGAVILDKYVDPAALTIGQVIALGDHEHLDVREWCWNFYQQQLPRIKFEKDASVKLLDSKWTDTRQFAIKYFKEKFSAEDWDIVALVTLADSVKPDIEALGRDIITKYFTEENGTEYLLKLSQHPSERMQLFATNYLERFAANDNDNLLSLEFYFRSVLTRVNKARVAKNRIFDFLLQEGRKSEQAANIVAAIITDVSATVAIGDKTKCIDIMLQLQSLYSVSTLLQVKEVEVR